VLAHYDVDSLCAMEELVVRAEAGDPMPRHTPDGDCVVYDVKVLSTLKGTAVQSGQTIRVAGLDVYKRAPGIAGAPDSWSPIRKGDIVYLFLVPKQANIGYSKYRLVDADWKVIESGARLVVGDRVYTFGQYFPNDPPPWPNETPKADGPSSQPFEGYVVGGFVAMTPKTFGYAPIQSVDSFEQRTSKAVAFVADLNRQLKAAELEHRAHCYSATP
jgi:hypothetical protein